jgi:uncharacterized protein with PIN domain
MGGALVFTIAIVIALGAVVGKRVLTWRKERAALRRPGRDESAPIVVASYDELEAVWRRERCATCSGRLEQVGESNVTGAAGSLALVLLRCEACERRDAIYFDTSAIAS